MAIPRPAQSIVAPQFVTRPPTVDDSSKRPGMIAGHAPLDDEVYINPPAVEDFAEVFKELLTQAQTGKKAVTATDASKLGTFAEATAAIQVHARIKAEYLKRFARLAGAINGTEKFTRDAAASYRSLDATDSRVYTRTETPTHTVGLHGEGA